MKEFPLSCSLSADFSSRLRASRMCVVCVCAGLYIKSHCIINYRNVYPKSEGATVLCWVRWAAPERAPANQPMPTNTDGRRFNTLSLSIRVLRVCYSYSHIIANTLYESGAVWQAARS